MRDPSPASFSSLPIYTLWLGSVAGLRQDEGRVTGLVCQHVQSFSLTACNGYFQGQSDPGWAISVAHFDHLHVARLAERLRTEFDQEGVGIEAFGRYLRCRADHGSEAVAAELWALRYGFYAAYSRTVFRTEGGVSSWPKDFAIVTAYATTGESWSDERNQAADAALQARIETMGVWSFRVTGHSPDGTHAEPGWAVELSVERARKLGSEFLQDAIYAVSAGALNVVNCDSGHNAPVGAFESRLNVKKHA